MARFLNPTRRPALSRKPDFATLRATTQPEKKDPLIALEPTPEITPEVAAETAPPPRPKRVLSQRALEANRRNAKNSTGPRTEAGKAASRLNAGRHRITAQVTILPDEERVAAEQFCVDLAATFKPEGLEEIQLARGIAEGYWRLNQVRAAITNRFALSVSTYNDRPMAGGHPQIEYAIHVAETFERDADSLRLMSLYEQRTMNLLQRQKRELELMQKVREEKRQSAFTEAQALYAHAKANGESWDPDVEAKHSDGFVFSPSLLEAAIGRRTRLHAACMAESGVFFPEPTRPIRKPSTPFRSAAPRAA